MAPRKRGSVGSVGTWNVRVEALIASCTNTGKIAVVRDEIGYVILKIQNSRQRILWYDIFLKHFFVSASFFDSNPLRFHRKTPTTTARLEIHRSKV